MRNAKVLIVVTAIAVLGAVACARKPNNQLLVRFDCRFGDGIHLPIAVDLGESRATVMTSSDSGFRVPVGNANGELVIDSRDASQLAIWIRADGTAKARGRFKESAPATDVDGSCERL